MFVHHSRYNSN